MSRFEQHKRPERPAEKLERLMSAIAQKQNQELFFDGVPLLKDDCTINMEAFGGAAEDEKKIWEQDVKNSAAQNQNVQEYYKAKYNAEGPEQIVKQFRQNREEHASVQLEKAVTAIFYKILKSEYVVVRSAVYDDYFNGIDNVIVNKKTGDIICAFDEVHGQEGQERYDEKKRLKFERSKRQGSELKYGIGLENGRLAKKSIKNIPVFYLALSSGEFKELLGRMNFDAESSPNEAEKATFDKLLGSLKSQANQLEKEKLSQEVRSHLFNFRKSSARMEELRAGL